MQIEIKLKKSYKLTEFKNSLAHRKNNRRFAKQAWKQGSKEISKHRSMEARE